MTKQVCDGMVDRGWGRIINISSVNGQKGAFGQTNYSAAKAGMHGFTKALALEVARKGVTVNTISPGYIGTKMVMAIPKDVLDTKIIPQIPMGRLGKPEEVAGLVAYLVERRSGVPHRRQHRDQRRPAHVLTQRRARGEASRGKHRHFPARRRALSRRQAARMPPATHVIAGSLPESLLCSRARGWDGHRRRAAQLPESWTHVVQTPEHVIGVHLAGTVNAAAHARGQRASRTCDAGDVTITPVGGRASVQRRAKRRHPAAARRPAFVRQWPATNARSIPTGSRSRRSSARAIRASRRSAGACWPGSSSKGVDSICYVDTLTASSPLHLLRHYTTAVAERLARARPAAAQAAARPRLHRREPARRRWRSPPSRVSSR